jgi:hypothetical protein
VVVWALDELKSGSGYGHHAGGYYSDAMHAAEGSKADKAGRSASVEWVPEVSTASPFTAGVGRVVSGVLAVVVVVAFGRARLLHRGLLVRLGPKLAQQRSSWRF